MTQPTSRTTAVRTTSTVAAHTEPATRFAGRAVSPLVTLAAVLVLLATVSAATWPAVRQQYREQTRAQTVLATARQVVADLLTVDQAHPRATLDRLRAGSTGEFTQQLVSQSDAFVQAVTGAKVNATASVAEAGIRSVTDHEAMVLVSATTSVTNDRLPGSAPRQYRILVQLRNVGPAWLVAKMEFLP